MVPLEREIKLVIGAFLLIVSFAVGACATSHQRPSSDKLQNLPIVQFGAPRPEGEFVLHFPAGRPIPVSVSIEGNLFTESASGNLTVTLRDDIYVYKNRVSLDRKQWVKDNQLIQRGGYKRARPVTRKISNLIEGS